MHHKGTVRIETERLILRRFTPDDREAIFRNCWSEHNVWKWTNYPSLRSADNFPAAGLFTEKWFAAYDRPDRYSWAIELKVTGEVIGRFFGMHPDDSAAQIELAYEMGSKWWNRGLMTEAARAVLRFFIREVGFHRVYAWHAAGNPASGRVMQKCGMHADGRGTEKCNMGTVDAVYYSIFNHEFTEKED